MKSLLIFDYDGTIHNTMKIYEPSFWTACRWLLKKGYIPPKKITSERIQGWLGMNYKEMWNDFMPELPDKIKEEAGNIIGNFMVSSIEQHKAVWYPNTEDILKELRKAGYPMVVLSNCRVRYKKASWNEFSMEKYFLDFYDCESYDFAPKSKIIKNIKKRFPQKSIVIGDRSSDLACAKAGRSLFVGCRYGYGKEGELKGSDFYINSIKELPQAVLELDCKL